VDVRTYMKYGGGNIIRPMRLLGPMAMYSVRSQVLKLTIVNSYYYTLFNVSYEVPGT